jgi:hypothetical protein
MSEKKKYAICIHNVPFGVIDGDGKLAKLIAGALGGDCSMGPVNDEEARKITEVGIYEKATSDQRGRIDAGREYHLAHTQ